MIPWEVYMQMKIRILLRVWIWLSVFPLFAQSAAAVENAVGQEAAAIQTDFLKTAAFIGPHEKPAAPVARAFAADILPLPRAANTEDLTFLGWSEKPGQKADPDYLDYQRVRLLQNKTF